MPGNLSNATSIFGSNDIHGYSITNGSGKGFIANTYIADFGNKGAWQQLALAGFINGVYQGESQAVQIGTTFPVSKFSSTATFMFYSSTLWNNYPSFNSLAFCGATGLGINVTLITSRDSMRLDSKIDDGLPYMGKMICYYNCASVQYASSPSHTLPYLPSDSALCTCQFALEGNTFI